MADATPSQTLLVKVDGKRGILRFDSTTFAVIPLSAKGTLKQTPTLSTSIRNVLFASLGSSKDGSISVATLASKSRQHVLVHITARSEEQDENKTREWVEKLMALAYDGVAPKRKFKVLVNPMGGKGYAKKIYETRVKPILEAAQSVFDTQFTAHRFHAEEIAKSMAIDVDGILALSGDGLPHEIINGLASRVDAVAALRVPVVPVPTGSANGFNVNLQGPKQGFDVGLAILNAIKGKPLDLDLCSVVQGETRRWSFFSQAFGLMADIDLGTEFIRWMGDTRFIIGYLRGVLAPKPVPLQLSIKLVKSDKQELLEDLVNFKDVSAANGGATHDESSPVNGAATGSASSTLPEDRYALESTDSEGWIKCDKPILYIYGGMMPYVALDLLQFPMAHPSEGVLDLVVQEVVSRATLLGAMDGAENGMQFWMDSQKYYKALAFRIEPNPGSKGNIAIDGETFPWAPIYVEAHRGLARTLSLHGTYISTFVPSNPKRRAKK